MNAAILPAGGNATSPGNRNLSSVIDSIRDDGPSGVDELPAARDARPASNEPVTAGAAAAEQLAAVAPRTRIRALPGREVMSRVAAVVALLVLLGVGALFNSGRNPVIDERGLHLTRLNTDPVSTQVSLRDPLEESVTGWPAIPGQLLSPGPAAAPAAPWSPALTVPAAGFDGQQVLERLEGLTAAVTALQSQLESDRGEGAGQAVRLAAVETQLAALQQQIDAQRLSPGHTVKKAAPAGADKPVAVQGGWVVNVASSSQAGSLGELQAKLLERDIRTELQRVEGGDRPRYRLRVTGFTSRGEAKRYAASLAGKAGIKGAWAGRR